MHHETVTLDFVGCKRDLHRRILVNYNSTTVAKGRKNEQKIVQYSLNKQTDKKQKPYQLKNIYKETGKQKHCARVPGLNKTFNK